MVHMLGQAVGANTDATHGMTLAAVSLPYYRHICSAGLPKFVRFAKEVWGVSAEGQSDEDIRQRIEEIFHDLQDGPVEDFRDPKLFWDEQTRRACEEAGILLL